MPMRNLLCRALAVGLLTVPSSPSIIQAATITVTTLEDEWNEDGDCSCREAIIAANYDARVDACEPGAGHDEIVFASGLAGGTIRVTLSGGLKAIQSLTLRGHGITFDGGGTQDLLHALADPGNPPIEKYVLEGVTLRNSRALTLRVVAKVVELRDCLIEDNGHVPVGGLAGVSSVHDEFLAERVVFRRNRGSNALVANGPVVPALTSVRTVLRDCRFEDHLGGALLQQTAGINVVEIYNTQVVRNGSGIFIANTQPRDGQRVLIRDSLIAGNGPAGARALQVNNASLILERTRILTNQGAPSTAGVALSATGTNYTAVLRECEIRGNLGGEDSETAGGLLASGLPVILEDSTVADNRTRAPASGNGAGGIRYSGPRLEVRRSTISGNAITNGQRTGGIRYTGELILENSTISGNAPAGIDAFGVVRSRLINNTIVLNEGVGLAFTGGTGEGLILANNLLAANRTFDLSGTALNYAGGNNLIGAASRPTLPTDLLGANPDLLPLADNGGFTQTHALGPQSAALDAGNNEWAASLSTDQRGQARIAGAQVDIGAVESAGPPPTPPWIGDLVWEDLNGNGVRDPREPGLHAVKVRLWQDKNGNGLRDDDPEPFRIRVTGGDGRYEFAELPPGRYLVDVEVDPAVLRNNPALTTPQAIIAAEVGPNDQFNGADFGFQARGGAIDVRIWEDCLPNGVVEGAENALALVPLILHRDSNDNSRLDDGDALLATGASDPFGRLSFPELATARYFVRADNSVLPSSMARSTPGNPVTLEVEGGRVQDTGVPAGVRTASFGYFHGSISGVIAFDTDGDGVANPFLDEPLAGVEVRLHYDDNADGVCDPGDPVISVDFTFFDGTYYFDELPPEGFYLVTVNQATLPPKATTLVSGTLPIVRRPQHFQQTCEQVPPPLLYRDSSVPGATLGDLVWRDTNANGLQDPGEPGVPHYRVRLLSGDSTNILATTFTDASGLYEFRGLAPGTYRVAFGPSLAFLELTARDQASDDTRDSDPDPATGLTGPITLAAGQKETSVDAGLTGAAEEPVHHAPTLSRAVLREGGRVQAEFSAASGFVYRLQFTERLSPASWRSIGPGQLGGAGLSGLEAELPEETLSGFLRLVSWRE